MVRPLRIDAIDISHHQDGPFDLAAAKRAGVKVCWIKATEGQTLTDAEYSHWRRRFNAAGIKTGAYSFARPEDIGPRGDAVAECRHFIATAKPQPGDALPWLDLEVRDDPDVNDTPELKQWAREWIAEHQRLLGVKPIVYTPYDLGDAIKGCYVVRPRYNNDNEPPVLRWDIWQFSNGLLGVPNRVPGVGHVDINTFRPGLTVDQLLIPRRRQEAAEPKGNLPVDPDRSRVTQPFADPGSYASRRDAHGPAGHHTGIDYGDDESGRQIDGQPVRTVVPGDVVISDHNSTMGHWVGVFDPKTKLLVTYWHLRDRTVDVGDSVELGDVVGHVGNTGNSTAAHLHLQVNRGRTFDYHAHIDPAVAINAYPTLQEDDMANHAQQLDKIEAEVKALRQDVSDLHEFVDERVRASAWRRDTDLRDRIKALRKQVADGKADVAELSEKLDALLAEFEAGE